jgi:hypothetical protein
MENTTAQTFAAGQTYAIRSIGDNDCVFRFTVLSRSAKRITIKSNFGVKTVGVKPSKYHNGSEMAYPLGNYSMSPMMVAGERVEA